MRVSVSEVLEYQQCPVRWHNRYVSRRARPEQSQALADGTYWHLLVQNYFEKRDLPNPQNTQQERMWEFVRTHQVPYLAPMHVEEQMEVECGGYTLVGTPDGVVDEGEGVWSLQWKTCAGGTDLERQMDKVQFSYHEVAYERMIALVTGKKVLGTIVGVWKKLTKAELSAGVRPFSLKYVTRPEGYGERVFAELTEWIVRMAKDAGQSRFDLLPVRSRCIIGYSRCQYWSACYDGVGLEADCYEDVKDRYGEIEEE